MQDKLYFIQRNGIKEGPFKLDQLRTLSLTATTLIWESGMDDWTEAWSIKEMHSIISASPNTPEISVSSNYQAIDRQKLTPSNYIANEISRTIKFATIALGLAIACAIIYFLFSGGVDKANYYSTNKDNEPKFSKPFTQKELDEASQFDQLPLRWYTWKPTGEQAYTEAKDNTFAIFSITLFGVFITLVLWRYSAIAARWVKNNTTDKDKS